MSDAPSSPSLGAGLTDTLRSMKIMPIDRRREFDLGPAHASPIVVMTDSPAAVGFAAILDPVTPDEFFREYRGKKPLHIPGRRDKFAGVMSWQELNRILNMTAIWTAASLEMALDEETIPPDRYCRAAIDRRQQPVMQPDADRVLMLLRQGASLVANDIDTLGPGLAAAARAFEEALGVKAQANLYCSWHQHQAFPVHIDTHDVFALHAEGEKVWRVYEGRLDDPIAHPRFKTLGQEYHEKAKGAVLMEVPLRPGDLLYIPRGQYHDALASSAGTVHVAFGVTAVIGIDYLNTLFDRAIEDPLFRANAPRPVGDGADDQVAAHLGRLAARLGEIAASPEAIERMRQFHRDFKYRRGGFDLPEAATAARYRVRAKGLKLVPRGDEWSLEGEAGAAPIPRGQDRFVAWVIERESFSRPEIDAAFADQPSEKRAEMLRDLVAMKVIEAA